MNKSLAYYLELPYTVILRPDEEGDIVARIAELEGCSAHGQTSAEALENIEEAKKLWIEDALQCGDKIPEPVEDNRHLPSGKWLQRVPRSLHKKLVAYAEREEISLNQYVTSILAEAVGHTDATDITISAFKQRVLNALEHPSKHQGKWVNVLLSAKTAIGETKAAICYTKAAICYTKAAIRDPWADLHSKTSGLRYNRGAETAVSWRPENDEFFTKVLGWIPNDLKTKPMVAKTHDKKP